jgi:hypothetical protein
MDTMEMIAKALESVVEEKVSEKAGAVNLDSILEFIKTADRDSLNKIMVEVGETEIGAELNDDYYQRRLEQDDDVVMKEDIDVDLIDDIGLLEDCFERYVLRWGAREIVKNLIDEI